MLSSASTRLKLTLIVAFVCVLLEINIMPTNGTKLERGENGYRIYIHIMTWNSFIGQFVHTVRMERMG